MTPAACGGSPARAAFQRSPLAPAHVLWCDRNVPGTSSVDDVVALTSGLVSLPPLFACRLCGTEVDPNDQHTYRRVSGWAQNRKPNVVVLLASDTGFACAMCVDTAKLRTVPNPGQGELF